MSLTLFYITNNPQVAKSAEKYSVDRIWVDLETRGKKDRQGGMNTVQSDHVMSDVSLIREALEGKASLMVRTNPLYDGSRSEIDEIISRGADIVMLPYFSTADEAARFVDMVGGRARTCLLVETKAAEENIEDILAKAGADEIHIGLNDLHLQYGKTFMFELLADGTVERLAQKIKSRGIPFGFGGIAKLDEGLLPARHVIGEHYRLGSSMAILSRSFYDSWIAEDMEEVERAFKYGVGEIRDYEKRLEHETPGFFENNRQLVGKEVSQIVEQLKMRAV